MVETDTPFLATCAAALPQQSDLVALGNRCSTITSITSVCTRSARRSRWVLLSRLLGQRSVRYGRVPGASGADRTSATPAEYRMRSYDATRRGSGVKGIDATRVERLVRLYVVAGPGARDMYAVRVSPALPCHPRAPYV